MAPRARSIHRLLPLVAVLAVATASVLPAAAAAPASAPLAAVQASAERVSGRTAAVSGNARPAVERAPANGSTALADARPAAAVRAAIDVPAAPVRTESKIAAVAAPSGKGGSGSTAPAAYRGRNHVWIPALGVSRSVSWFACSRSTALAHVVYRWGCAGSNNVYLMGHASSVFRPLHDAYLSGRLRKGMKVIYADANGRVRTYAVTFWKVVKPDGDVGWAYAAQSRPSLTLQTCVGANSTHRLVVRLVATG